MRVPPDTGDATSGSRSAVARSIARVRRSAAATRWFHQKGKLAGDHADTATADHAFPSDHGLVLPEA